MKCQNYLCNEEAKQLYCSRKCQVDRSAASRVPFWRLARAAALQDSIALRLLCRAHGRWVKVAPTRWDW